VDFLTFVPMATFHAMVPKNWKCVILPRCILTSLRGAI
jgi:hypothetical protein